MRFQFFAAVLVTGIACTDALPCSNCPSMEGDYAVEWQAPTTTVTGCALATQPQSTLAFTRVGSSLRSSVNQQPLTGTLFDTYDFTLSGGVDVAYNLRGRLVTGGGDGGTISLTGSLRTSVRADAGICDFDEKFTATKK